MLLRANQDLVASRILSQRLADGESAIRLCVATHGTQVKSCQVAVNDREIAVSLQDVAGLIDVNLADKSLLTSAFSAIGLRTPDVVAQLVLDRRDQRMPFARNADIRSLTDEFNQDNVEVSDWFTVYSGQPSVSKHDAAAQVLRIFEAGGRLTNGRSTRRLFSAKVGTAEHAGLRLVVQIETGSAAIKIVEVL